MYKNKYLKYKNKYIQLKNQIGGIDCENDVELISKNNINEYNDDELISINNTCYSVKELYSVFDKYYKSDDGILLDPSTNKKTNQETTELLKKLYDNLNNTSNYYIEQNNIPKNKIYTIEGHGCTTNEILRVPENCQYVTYCVCDYSTDVDEKSYKFINLFCKYPDIFNNPKDNMFQLKTLFGIDLKVHYYEPNTIKNSGNNTYINAKYKPLLELYLENNIYQEGLIHNKSTHIETYKSGLFIAGSGCSNLPNSLKNIQKDKPILTFDDIRKIYQHSLYPTFNNIKERITKENVLHRSGKIFEIDQKTLFKILPGTYYNIVCRDPCNKNENELSKVKLRRDISVLTDIEFMDKYKTTELHTICKNNEDITSLSNSIIQDLINARDEMGRSPIHYAVLNNNNENVEQLLFFTPELNYKDKYGNTPLHLACENNNDKIIKLFLENPNININPVNNKLETPIDIICNHENNLIAKLLIKKGATTQNIVTQFYIRKNIELLEEYVNYLKNI